MRLAGSGRAGSEGRRLPALCVRKSPSSPSPARRTLKRESKGAHDQQRQFDDRRERVAARWKEFRSKRAEESFVKNLGKVSQGGGTDVHKKGKQAKREMTANPSIHVKMRLGDGRQSGEKKKS